jgi:hypothetical protein
MKKKSLLLTAVATLGFNAATMAQNLPSYVPTSGLVGWWPFNGNANDESGNGNNGTVDGATLTTDRNNNVNKAYSFDGVNDQINGSANNFPIANTARSLSVWFNVPQLPLPGNSFVLINYGQLNNNNACGIGVTNDGLAFFSWLAPNDLIATTIISTNQWYNVTSTFDGINSKLYLNGSLIISANQIKNTIVNNLNIGFNSINQYTLGKIDDIGIWNRALTQQEITDLYNGCQLSVNTQPTNQTVNINNNAQFVVSSFDPSATYQWQTDLGVGFQNLSNAGQYSGVTTGTLTVSNVTMSNNNQNFRCIVSSGSCSDTSNVAVLTVNNNVSINETSQDMLFSVFPNPAQSVINVNADSKLIGSVYSIYDNTGRVVLTGKLNSQSTTIELGNLSGGIYMFSVGENMKQKFKVIKE